MALTGAGISAESGIPTFRGAGGLWLQPGAAQRATIGFFRADPAGYWATSRERGRAALAARPNAAHQALAEFESSGRLQAVVTQNTDGLHLDAGSRHVIELHGSGRQVECLDCGALESRAAVQGRLETEMPPLCRRCGGCLLKPTVVLFGEPLPPAALAAAVELARSCDLMLVVGSSLAVQPAAQLPLVALESGARLLIVNAEPTRFDHLAAAVIQGPAAEVLPALLQGARESHRRR